MSDQENENNENIEVETYGNSSTPESGNRENGGTPTNAVKSLSKQKIQTLFSHSANLPPGVNVEVNLNIDIPISQSSIKLKVFNEKSVKEIIELILQANSIKRMEVASQLALYMPSTGVWLNEQRKLYTYLLKDEDTLELKSKPSAEPSYINIEVTITGTPLKETLKCLPETTIRGILQLLEGKKFVGEKCSLFMNGNPVDANLDDLISKQGITQGSQLEYKTGTRTARTDSFLFELKNKQISKQNSGIFAVPTPAPPQEAPKTAGPSKAVSPPVKMKSSVVPPAKNALGEPLIPLREKHPLLPPEKRHSLDIRSKVSNPNFEALSKMIQGELIKKGPIVMAPPRVIEKQLSDEKARKPITFPQQVNAIEQEFNIVTLLGNVDPQVREKLKEKLKEILRARDENDLKEKLQTLNPAKLACMIGLLAFSISTP